MLWKQVSAGGRTDGTGISTLSISAPRMTATQLTSQRAKALESGRKLLNTEIHKARRQLLHSLDMKLSGSASIALTYANDKLTDGAGAQLLRIYGVYAISRALGLPYIHSPLIKIGYQGLSALERNSASDGVVSEYHRIFGIPSDIELPESPIAQDMRHANLG
jgi:hypothetical protein